MTESNTAAVLVIGGGMAGLTAACELLENNIDVILLEAATRAGGRVQSVTTKLGSRLDIGGQWVGYSHHRLQQLTRQANLNIHKTYTKGTPIIIDKGRRVSLYSPPILLGGIVLVLFDILCRIRVPQAWNKTSIQKAISRVVPIGTTKRFLEALGTLSAAADLTKTSVYAFGKSVPLGGGLMTMLGNHGGAQDSLIAESIGSVAEILASRLGNPRLRTGMRVISINQHDEGGVTVRTASGEEFSAAKVIITIPPPMLKSVSFQPTLPLQCTRLQQGTQMGIVYKAFAVFARPFWRDGFGCEYIVLDSPPRGFSDCSPPGGPGHLCILVGGSAARDLDGLDLEKRRDLLLAPLVPFVGPQILEPLEWYEKAWHQDEFCGGGYTAMPLIGSMDGIWPMLHEPVGNIHWAGTETADEHPGYVEGAIQSGQRVAKEVLSAL